MVSILSTAVLGTTLAGRMFFSSTVLFSEPATNTANTELLSEHSSLTQILVLQVSKCTVESLRVQSPPGQLLLLQSFRLETTNIKGYDCAHKLFKAETTPVSGIFSET